jgi:hypothetical protein
LTQAQTAIGQALRSWRACGDIARQDAEARHGISYESDPATLEDGLYGSVLDLGTDLDQALIDLAALTGHLWHAEQQADYLDTTR